MSLRRNDAKPYPSCTSTSIFKPVDSFATADTSEWNSKSTFPNLSQPLFPKPESSKPLVDFDPLNLPTSSMCPLDIGHIYFNSFGPFDAYPPLARETPKSTDDDLEKYFDKLRICPRPRDTIVKDERRQPGLLRPMPIRSTGLYRTETFQTESPRSDGSLSEESLV